MLEQGGTPTAHKWFKQRCNMVCSVLFKHFKHCSCMVMAPLSPVTYRDEHSSSSGKTQCTHQLLLLVLPRAALPLLGFTLLLCQCSSEAAGCSSPAGRWCSAHGYSPYQSSAASHLFEKTLVTLQAAFFFSCKYISK